MDHPLLSRPDHDSRHGSKDHSHSKRLSGNWLTDQWNSYARTARLKFTVGLRDLWPYLAAMYLTCCFAENLTDLVDSIQPESELEFWMVWTLIEPCVVGCLLWLALRVPRESVFADVAFVGAIFADLLMGSKLSRVLQNSGPEYHLTSVLLWFYTIISMFVFAGFHMLSIVSFWLATAFLALVALPNLNPHIAAKVVVVVGFGAVILTIASFIQYQTTTLSEIAECQWKAEHVLLEHATAGSCVVKADTGQLTLMSPNLAQVLGNSVRSGLSLMDLIDHHDQKRTWALLQDARHGLLGSTVVTFQLRDGAQQSSRFQDARLMAYSASESTIKICLQLLGEVRPDVSSEVHCDDPSLFFDTDIPTVPHQFQLLAPSARVLADLPSEGQLSPVGSYPGSAGAMTAPLNSNLRQEILARPVSPLSQSTVAWGHLVDLGLQNDNNFEHPPHFSTNSDAHISNSGLALEAEPACAGMELIKFIDMLLLDVRSLYPSCYLLWNLFHWSSVSEAIVAQRYIWSQPSERRKRSMAKSWLQRFRCYALNDCRQHVACDTCQVDDQNKIHAIARPWWDCLRSSVSCVPSTARHIHVDYLAEKDAFWDISLCQLPSCEGDGKGILYVEKLDPDGPAAMAGVRQGDVLIQIDGRDWPPELCAKTHSVFNVQAVGGVRVCFQKGAFRHLQTQASPILPDHIMDLIAEFHGSAGDLPDIFNKASCWFGLFASVILVVEALATPSDTLRDRMRR